jgi:hypothetical protein
VVQFAVDPAARAISGDPPTTPASGLRPLAPGFVGPTVEDVEKWTTPDAPTSGRTTSGQSAREG